ncbi:MAG: hypothetical protein Q7U35_07625 [Methanobacteriaceae archaeon]|nr:hypothetical protein [Methanobacteriaceae archaeon]MDP3034475.1 hypothetical protein [Methanobacteriaceae archaeon]MDP3484620.1 hypothetical protein [Methanobacteriaceae archaeon]MDP3622943.1 hypothetical protein [Methanobacteriaceae archaeon]
MICFGGSETIELREILKDKSTEYHGRLKRLEKEAEDILPEIRKFSPKYTNHDLAHKKGVEWILNLMIPDNVKENLYPSEIFYLLVATWFHDVGMSPLNPNEEKEFNEMDYSSKNQFEEDVRINHHIRSQIFIKKNRNELNLSEREAKVISEIAKSHRSIDIEKEIRDDIHDEVRIRTKFLGGLLRLADECHITEDRISRLFNKTITSPWQLLNHFRKHEIVRGIIFNENSDNNIRISGTARSEEELNILKSLKEKIKDELDSVKTIFNENEIYLNDVILEIDQNKLLRKKIIFNLSGAGKNDINTIISEIDGLKDEILPNLQELTVDGFIQSKDNYYFLSKDINSFERLVNCFSGDLQNFEFFNSDYVQEMIGKLIYHLQDQYNIIYSPKEIEDRVFILKNSPTAVYLSLYGKDLLNNPQLDLSLIQGDPILDQIFLLGLSYDIFKYNVYDVKLMEIVDSISEKSQKRIPELMELYEQMYRCLND